MLGVRSVSEMKSSKRRVQTQRCVSDNQPSIMDILTKKKAAPKAPRAAPREESPPSEATAAVAKKPGPPRGRKATKRLTSSSDSDSDFGSRPSKSVAAKKSKRDDDDSYSIDLTADSPAAAAPRTRPGRLKKPVQYLESSDEDDMF